MIGKGREWWHNRIDIVDRHVEHEAGAAVGIFGDASSLNCHKEECDEELSNEKHDAGW